MGPVSHLQLEGVSISEYLADNGSRFAYCLEVRVVQVVTATGEPTISYRSAHRVSLHLRSSKTDQDGHGVLDG